MDINPLVGAQLVITTPSIKQGPTPFLANTKKASEVSRVTINAFATFNVSDLAFSEDADPRPRLQQARMDKVLL